MLARPRTRAIVPSRGALRVLRRLALAGSTVGAIGSACMVMTITYDIHQRIRVAERVIENKRSLESACPSYNPGTGARKIAAMMEAAEAGEFMGLDSMKEREKQRPAEQAEEAQNTGRRGGGRNDTLNSHTTHIKSKDTFSKNIPHDSSSPMNHHTPFPTRSIPSDSTSPASPISNGTEKKFKRVYKKDEPASPPEKIESLLREQKPIEAAHNFLAEFNNATPQEATAQREVAVRIFYANLRQDNVFLARNLFHWLEKHDRVTPALWEVLLLGLIKSRSIESVAKLYIAYNSKFDLSRTLTIPILRSLLSSLRFEDAKRLVFKCLRRHERSASICSIYLAGLWQKTRSVELLESQFRKLLSKAHDYHIPLSERFFNPVLKAYIEVGFDDKANYLIEEMTVVHKVKIGIRTKRLLAIGQALKCDWEGVYKSLEEIHRSQKCADHAVTFLKCFDRIFLEYWLAHPGDKIREFVINAIENYGLVPDQPLFNHIIKAYIQKGTPPMLSELVQISQKKGWKLELPKAHLEELLREQQIAAEMSPAGLWRMYRASEHKFGYATASQQLLGYDRISFPHSEVFSMPWTHEPTAWWRRAMSMSEPSKPINQFAPLHKQMLHHLNTGELDKVISLYENAKRAGKFMEEVHVNLALTACLAKYRSVEKARSMLEEADALRKFSRPVPPLFFQALRDMGTLSPVSALKVAVLNFYSFLEDRFMPIKHHMLNSLSTKWFVDEEPRTLLKLMSVISRSKYGAIEPFNAVGVKLIARACAKLNNRDGVRWAIMTGLSRSSARNRDLVVEIYRDVEELRRRKVSNRRKQQATKVREEHDELYQLAQLLEKTTVEDGLPLGEGPQTAELYSEELKEKLANWRERKELELAVNPFWFADTGDLKDWSEDVVCPEFSEMPWQ
ncbi:hypothetical protein AJ80_08376 [Polytolypa hystricis UAMH7299]|uniref:Pentatricopeptide repeat protein n=1 Tax=Polytolypa hystricis (strain UAMH7299) TaxID=1447883 RepID=A0A2B7X9E5_POLH7|nr:hypothetical protein AJ80_08376 [Polytolypa hystricis UAMH7299]